MKKKLLYLLREKKIWVSCLLSISASGGKLTPFNIFKGEKDSRILKELSKNPHVLNKDKFIGLNKNSGTTLELINTWINKVVLPYTKKFDGNRKFLLVWLRAKTDLNEETNKFFQK